MSIRYFARANSCIGSVNYMKSNLNGIQKVYLVSTRFDYLKSVFISRQASYLQDRGEECEYLCNPLRANTYDGFILRGKGIAVIDGQLIPADNSCITVDADCCIDHKCRTMLADYTKVTDTELADKLEAVYSVYSGAKKIHDEWEKLYIENMDFARLDTFCAETISRLVPEAKRDRNGMVYDRFFGAATDTGNINYIDNITDSLGKRYFIKGRPGTGKSTFLKKLASALCGAGYDCEVYHCGFDPASLDMVVCRELDFCVFDSTSPHEKFPVEQSDEILDFYVNSGLEGVDENLSHKLLDVQLRYSKMMALSRLYLEEAASTRRELDDKVRECIDFEILNSIVYEILYQII